MAFSKTISKIVKQQKAKKAAAAQQKAQTDQARKEYATSLGDADQSTVSGRVKAAYGAEGFDNKMAQDVIKGAQFGEAVIGPEGLGRLGESDTLKAMEAQSAELAKGFSSEEMQARKEKGIQEIQGSTAAQSRAAQAALARSGVKGAAAGQQLTNIAASGVEARGNLERDLMIADREAQMQGLGIQQGVFQTSQAREQFNLKQAAKEKDVALQAGLGFAQMGSVDRGAQANKQAQVAAAKASRPRCFIEGTLIEMNDGSQKKIEDIELGDVVRGGIVYSLHSALVQEVYLYKGVVVSAKHAVLENGVWKRIEDTDAEKFEGVFPVYNLGTSEHRIFTQGIEFADFDETDKASEINDEESLEELNASCVKVLGIRRRL